MFGTDSMVNERLQVFFSSVFPIVRSELNREQQTQEQGLETGGSQSCQEADVGSIGKRCINREGQHGSVANI